MTIAFLALFLALPLRAQSNGEPKRFLIGFKVGASAVKQQETLDSYDARVVDTINELGIVIAEAPPNSPLASFKAQANPNSALEYVEEDVIVNWLSSVDSGFSQAPLPTLSEIQEAVPPLKMTAPSVQPSQLPQGINPAEVPWGVAKVDAPAAWANHIEGEGVRVAIIDTGLDATNPDLAPNYAGCYDAYDYKNSCEDGNGHGTHVAGTIAAALDGKGVVGVAPKARLYSVKTLGADGNAHISSILEALVWCGRNHMQVINMSLGSPIPFIFLHMAVEYAKEEGAVIVAAAGNNGHFVEYPAGYSEVIAVSAVDKLGHMPSWSSRGDKVEFIAPGVNILSTWPLNQCSNPPYCTHLLSGTSMATPHVAGLAALAISRGASGVDSVRKALTGAAKSIGLDAKQEGHGLIDANLIPESSSVSSMPLFRP